MQASYGKYSYFQPDEMLYIIRHESNKQLEDHEIDRLIEWGNRNKPDHRLEILRLRERELHFPGTKGLEPLKHKVQIQDGIKYESPPYVPREAFSIIPAKVRIIEEFRDWKNPDGHVESGDLSKLITNLDREENRDKQPLHEDGFIMEVVSPNWLVSPSSEYSGGGGPGAEPAPYAGQIDTEQYAFHFLSDEFAQLCPPGDEENRGAGVKVAIFDTAPCLHDLAEAYERYHKVDPKNQADHHPLLERLLGPNGSLHIHPASLDDLLRMRAVYLKDHNYKMTDHGLFVAGIINTIAPAAELHLYEVLNPRGVGDLESIAKGLWKVADEQYQLYMRGEAEARPLVVNCSLTLNIPLEGDPDNPNSGKLISANPNRPIIGHRLLDMDEEFLTKISNDSDWVKRAGAVIMWICDLLYWCGSRVIAAAGNEWRRGKDKGRPQARYPAAYQSVLGIGALPRGNGKVGPGLQEVSSYSNLSDEPGEVGVTTLGGEKGAGKGVLGIYIGKYPNGNPNDKDWAWWAGTSFATPIVSGAIATVMSGSNKIPITEDAIRKMYDKQVIENAKTIYKEDRLAVEQGTTNP